MSLWRQLRWRILAAQLLVVVVGAVTLAAADLLAEQSVAVEQLPGMRAILTQALPLAAVV